MLTVRAEKNSDFVAVGLKSDGTPGGRYTTGHCPVVVYVRQTQQRDTGPWRCSNDGTDDGTCLTAHHYVVRHHIFNLKLGFVHH